MKEITLKQMYERGMRVNQMATFYIEQVTSTEVGLFSNEEDSLDLSNSFNDFSSLFLFNRVLDERQSKELVVMLDPETRFYFDITESIRPEVILYQIVMALPSDLFTEHQLYETLLKIKEDYFYSVLSKIL